MRLRVIFAIMLLSIITAVWIKENRIEPPTLTHLENDAIILAFGDSLTYGFGAGRDQSYPTILQRRLGRTVINAGIPGELSEEGVARLPQLLDQYHPALLLLCHGGNDILQKKEREWLKANLESMVRMAQERRIGVILISVPDFSLLGLSPLPLYEEIADRYGIPLEASILSQVLHDNGTKSDPVHPNAAGYRKMAEAVEKVIREHYVLK